MTQESTTTFTCGTDPASESLYQEVVEGLTKDRKELPCKYFYDETGCRLFEEITRTDEYYLTRAELCIMHRHARNMADVLGPGCLLIEPGAGSAHKTRLLLAELRDPAGYIPIEIASEHLSGTVREFRECFPGLEVCPVYADFLADFELPVCRNEPRRTVAYFPGSTIGNLQPAAAADFLERLSSLCGEDGAIVVGADLKKDIGVLERAYNDDAGLTALFNLNLLTRVNREVGTDFRLDHFAHRAFYSPEHGRVEMHLVSLADQQVHIGDLQVRFAKGETIHTENCYKYSLEDFRALALSANLCVRRVWMDENRLFAVHYLTRSE